MRFLPVLIVLLFAAPAAGQDSFAARILAVHNAERAKVGVAPLVWSERLERDAQGWANTLARRGRMQHADQRAQGENLWMGTANYFTPEQMVGAWAAEKRDYRHGQFPNVARNGRVVGHYTQMVWRTTTQVGCAVARGDEDEFLVCRYSPPGNWIGQTAY